MRRRRGVTLFELTLVLTIMVILGAFAAPLVVQALGGATRVNAGADMVRARWADCRTQAIEESRPYCFSVIPNSRKFKVEPYQGSLQLDTNSAFLDPGSSASSGASGSSSNADGSSDNSSGSGLVIEDMLPEGVRFGTKDSPANTDGPESDGEYVPIAIFLPDGTAQDDVEITFGALGSAHVTLRLRAFTGSSVTVRSTGDDK